PGAQVLAQALGLRVAARRRGDPVAEEPVHDEVEAPQVRQRMALDGEGGGLGDEAPERVDGERLGEPGVGGRVPRPHPHVRVPAFVPRAGAADRAERQPLGRSAGGGGRAAAGTRAWWRAGGGGGGGGGVVASASPGRG